MKRIRKDSLKTVLNEWARRYAVVAPIRTDKGECIFDLFDEERFTFDHGKLSMPPKRWLMPQSEVIFQVEGGRYRQSVSSDAVLLFGIRSCDLTGLNQSLSFMSGELDDPYYTARASSTLIVVTACAGPQSPSCFCTSTSSGPCADSGFDLQLYDEGDSYLVEIGSEHGAELASSDIFEEVDDGAGYERALLFKRHAQMRIPVVPEVSAAMDRLRTSRVPDELWDNFGAKCISCGGCSFVCPTCTCFTVSDRVVSEGNGQRVRAWDTCLYGGFTREASGHNPRATKSARVRRRYEHKLLYHTDRDTCGGLSTCVGCGRCSDYCPVHIGLIEVAKTLSSLEYPACAERRYSEACHE